MQYNQNKDKANQGESEIGIIRGYMDIWFTITDEYIEAVR